MECQYKPVERLGLYLMVIILLLCGPCSNYDREHIDERLDKIEIQIQNINHNLNNK